MRLAILDGAHGFGTKGPKSTDPVRARTLFRIGSMTKSLTATAFMTLVQEGKADPTATLKSVVPDVALNTASRGEGPHVPEHRLCMRPVPAPDHRDDDTFFAQGIEGRFPSRARPIVPSGRRPTDLPAHANPNRTTLGAQPERRPGGQKGRP